MPDATHPLPCFACGKDLEPAFSDRPSRQPYGGLMFDTGGNYGSTVFDPMSSHTRLHIIICDNCIVTQKERVLLLTYTPRASLVNAEPWEPDDGED